ncbi:hypothetical protein A1O3_01722 [Capronia epimyces CBS 606.96]|uniref:Uncharacterized protein n=1 Tax=Capronia epimyces CBS 606.96 TaxID=1182542 RepID=W9YTZ6_9EURO|nr:uncharacterized protein A1O3_01722 [Capronia epimyces CBS 606.96]EXJ93165.1 hypothetical protein A1O3_01722 [Capronia epimyces CBS 606.96]
MKIIALLPLLTLTASLAAAAPYQPVEDDGASAGGSGSFNAIVNPRSGQLYRDDRVPEEAAYAIPHEGAGARPHHLKRDASAEPVANADANPDPFYPIHPNPTAGPDMPPNAGAHGAGDALKKFAQGYGFGHGPVVQKTRPKKAASRRAAMPEAHAEPEPEPAPAPAPAPGVGSLGIQNNNGKKGKTPSADDLCDARHMVCGGLQQKFRALYGVFQNN